MAQNNYRIAGATIYISKAGHDSNAGTINEPRKTWTGHPTAGQTYVIGSGIYTQAIPGGSLGTSQTCTIKADGKVVFDGNSGAFNITNPQGIIEDFVFQNYLRINQTSTGTHVRQFARCTFKSIPEGYSGTDGGTKYTFNTCKFLGFGMTQSTVVSAEIIFGILVNCFQRTLIFRSSYVDNDSVLIHTGTAAGFRNNNINGLIRLPITGPAFADFAIQDQFTGTPQDNGYATGVEWLNETNLTAAGYTGTVAGWDTAVATCINRDPKFNDVSGEDFTLQSDSPHIRRALDGVNNIGGTRIARSVINTDDNGTTVFVEPSAEIDATVPTSYHIEDGETEGTIDYIFDLGSVAPLDFIDLKAELKFDSDFAGGTVQNEDVPDSEPLTNDYALKVNTAASATPDLNKIIVPTGLITSGMWVRVAGEAREVTGVSVSSPNDTVTVASNFRAIVGAGVTVTYGTEDQLAALNPNRLTYQLRVSQSATKPTVDSDWDNDLDPSYGESGTFFTQEWGIRPVYAISGGIVYGGGDSERPIGATTQEIEGRWIQVRVYLRNNYSSNGL
jgi:hypothetical protein